MFCSKKKSKGIFDMFLWLGLRVRDYLKHIENPFHFFFCSSGRGIRGLGVAEEGYGQSPPLPAQEGYR